MIHRADTHRLLSLSVRQLNTLQGEISSWRAQLSEDQATLASEYKDIKHKYEVKLMDVKVRGAFSSVRRGRRLLADVHPMKRQAAELANIDLERYAKAMDMCVPVVPEASPVLLSTRC
jgi:biopolymer transport protein ExbB/TolQ